VFFGGFYCFFTSVFFYNNPDTNIHKVGAMTRFGSWFWTASCNHLIETTQPGSQKSVPQLLIQIGSPGR